MMITWIWAPVALSVALVVWLTIRYSVFVPALPGLPVLMYHKVHESRRDSLTVTRDQFEEQLRLARRRGLYADHLPAACRSYRSRRCAAVAACADHVRRWLRQQLDVRVSALGTLWLQSHDLSPGRLAGANQCLGRRR